MKENWITLTHKNGYAKGHFHGDIAMVVFGVKAFVFKRYGQKNMIYFFNQTPNLHYWEEKCIAGKTKEFSAEAFQGSINEFISEYGEDYPEVVDDLKNLAWNDEHDAIDALRDLDFPDWTEYFYWETYTDDFKTACQYLSEMCMEYCEGLEG